MEALYRWMFDGSANELLLNFKAGYFTGVMVALSLILALALFQYVFFHKKTRVKEISIPHAKGDLIISSQAISDMVEALVSSKFRYVAVKKVSLRNTKNGVVMDITGEFDLDGGHLPDIADEIREEVFKNLESRLGVISIKKIHPKIRKTLANHKTFS